MGTTYVKNFLVQVIVRVDFPTQLPRIETGLASNLVAKALEYFPIDEPRRFTGKEVHLSPEELQERTVEGIDWYYHGKNREKSLCVGKNTMFITYKTYQSYKCLRIEFLNILEELLHSYQDIAINRLGLRYINNIEIPEKEPLNWGNYLNKNLLSIFDVIIDKSKIARAVHVLELNYGDMNLRFQYGMHNPDFPAPIRKKIFLLDYDAYYQGLLTQSEIANNLDKFHDNIEQLFESNITEGLRRVMNDNH